MTFTTAHLEALILKTIIMKTIALYRKAMQYKTLLMRRYGLVSLRYSLAIIFLWFGSLKPAGVSPAEELVVHTVYWFSSDWFVPFLGCWEMAIGCFFLFRKTVRLALLMLAFQIPGTFLPLIFCPEVTFTDFPFGLTLEGQYIIKNLTLIAAAITIGGRTNQ